MTGEGTHTISGHECNMKQQVSIVYLTEKIPLAQSFLSSDMEHVIGEQYCNKHNLIVLENSADEIKILLAKESLLCIDELSKVLPKEKGIHAMVVEKEEILKFFTRI
jgi:hypothetical protein